ncbi:MAG: ABC transporter permease subunit [Anaerolineales bacterium]
MEPKSRDRRKTLLITLAAFFTFIVIALAVEVTDIDLSTLRSEQRQSSLTRVIRALFHPDIISYQQEEVIIDAPVYVPCPAEGIPPAEGVSPAGAYIVVTPACGEPGETVHVEGFGFVPNTQGPLRFVPNTEPPVSLGREVVETDEAGHFSADFVLPNRPNEGPQTIRAILRQSVGAPSFTKNAYDTWDKIIETIFLALLATIVGTLLAVPLSFFAARNLMKPVRSPLASIALSMLGWIAGIYAGLKAANWIAQFTQSYTSNVLISALSVLLIPVIVVFLIRWALPEEETQVPPVQIRLLRMAALVLVVLLAIYGLYSLAGLMMSIGTPLAEALRFFAFMGSFFFHAGDILRTVAPVFLALAAGGALGGLASRLGQQATEKLPDQAVKTMNILLAALAGATLMALFGAAIDWLYQVGRLTLTLWWPAAIGAALGAALALRTKAKDTLPIGLVIYYTMRTIFNMLRSVEALVMAIVFVIAVGIGPFAGVLALGLHTIVSLAKLYSEQVESISSGPLEAIQATGANRLQTIVYAVIPQVIPPFISYTMYRWDINVRMSTIIGFVGGGGIGFLLIQNTNLLNYRAAATQMLAIAVVVASLDYISSIVRERFT